MKRATLAAALFSLLLCACTGGSSTTLRPAVDKPVVGADGTLWDAIEAARGNRPERMRRLLSTRFVHHAILPNLEQPEPGDEEEQALANAQMEKQLLPFETIRARLYARYTAWLDEVVGGKVVEVERPSYEFKHRDGYGSARGPNKAAVKVYLHSSAAKQPQTLTVMFVQDGDSWRIDGFAPDPLFGEFIR